MSIYFIVMRSYFWYNVNSIEIMSIHNKFLDNLIGYIFLLSHKYLVVINAIWVLILVLDFRQFKQNYFPIYHINDV